MFLLFHSRVQATMIPLCRTSFHHTQWHIDTSSSSDLLGNYSFRYAALKNFLSFITHKSYSSFIILTWYNTRQNWLVSVKNKHNKKKQFSLPVLFSYPIHFLWIFFLIFKNTRQSSCLPKLNKNQGTKVWLNPVTDEHCLSMESIYFF